MRRRLLYHKTKDTEITYTYSKPVITLFEYDTVPQAGVTLDDNFVPAYIVTQIVTPSVGEPWDITIHSNDDNKQGLSTSFRIVPDNRDGVDIDGDTGALIVGEAVEGKGYYGVGTVYMTATLNGQESNERSYDVTQAMNPEQTTTNYIVDITKFEYDVAPAKGTNALYPNLEFTVTTTIKDSEGEHTTVDNVVYIDGVKQQGGTWELIFSKVSGSFGGITQSENGRVGIVWGIEETSEVGDDKIELGVVRVDVIASTVSEEGQAYKETTLYQDKVEEEKETECPMDILFYNKNDNKLYRMDHHDETYAQYPVSIYTPIGIVLTPPSDGTSNSGYGKDWMGVMALTDASLSSPETGTTNPSTIMLGNNSSYSNRMRTAIEVSNKKDSPVPSMLSYCDNSDGPTDGIIGTIDDPDSTPDYNEVVVSAPTDKNSTVATYSDAWAGYAKKDGHKALSPYRVSDEYKTKYGDFEDYNAAAYEECLDSDANVISAFSDYDGEFNSLAILLGKSWNRGREWIENTTSNSNSNNTDCPAVEACWKYAPEGTAQGGWYLPGLGELSLMAARFKKINDTLTTLATYYGVSVSSLKDGNIPYLSSTNFLTQVDASGEITAYTAFALFPNVDGDMGYNRIFTTTVSGTETNGYVRPFKKLKVNAGTYELMPAHRTQTFCNGNSDREWFGQKFILSLRRGCLYELKDAASFGNNYLRIYGYKVRGENDATKINSSPRLLAEVWVPDGLTVQTASTWPADTNGNYSGDEKGINIVGRFTTGYSFDTDGAYDDSKGGYVDMDTDDFDRDGTVEPGWYILYGIGLTGSWSTSVLGEEEIFATAGTIQTITKKEIDMVNGVESKEAFFDTVKNTTIQNLQSDMTDKPFYIGQFDRPVALLFASSNVGTND